MAAPIDDGSSNTPRRRHINKIREKVDLLSSGLSRVGVSIATTWNPNHRHDEEHEKVRDAEIEKIRDGHRFRSFAPERENNLVKWHIDGHDYFWAMSEMIDKATHTIMILDWWLSPELQLRRPGAYYPEWRLDRLLKRKAEEGVLIYIQVYKEVSSSMSLGSKHTKHALEDLHDNIAVMRHPDHTGGELVYYFSHHEKLCVVDGRWAAMGGLDACWGRWDTPNHPIADVHPTQFQNSLFPGQDYNNSRIMDFQTVEKYASNELCILEAGRMPWHDTSLTLTGPVVEDLVAHFSQRWNFVKKIKYKHDSRMDWLTLPEPWNSFYNPDAVQDATDDEQFRREHPHMSELKGIGNEILHPRTAFRSHIPRQQEEMGEGGVRVQVVRSSADWSHGILVEDSIQQAYISMIREANHCIYIENQFLTVITTTATGNPVKNLIGAAIVERIVSAAKAGRPFKVFVFMPEIPAFPGDIQGQSGLKAIMEAQYRSINRGGHSIFEKVREAGFDPNNYISFWNLRTYDRINAPKGYIKQMEEASGVTFHEAQVANARLFVGQPGEEVDDEVVYIEKAHDQLTKAEDTNKKKKTAEDAVPLPKTVEDAIAIIEKFESGAPRNDLTVSDNIGQNSLQSGVSVNQEPWLGTKEEERDSIVNELLYIHSKIMIVDDRRVIIGSANLNDRSQNGDHDSEIAIVIEDTDLVEATMGGKKVMVAKLAASWRRALMREHLGLQPPLPPLGRDNQPTDNMTMVGTPNAYDWGSQDDQLVADPLTVEFERLMTETGKQNRAVYDRVFRSVPNDMIRSWAQYKDYVGKNAGVNVGHVANSELSLHEIKELLSTVKGHIVPMPINFLIEEKYLTEGDFLTVNPITLAIYI
ncbi:uncharacterized protein CcaverHIS019_0311940 [Cutaneotrichosporon cavernicola]|uniref:Phospholipase n=1 Tax=Cutaneotrichosporon cavernicola TaxID=279322 RepID=A0AA48QV81_9TREE|nr:uncharacterized protein CcaverHIS019_0311940 [Cutaneotrichosporon cavernicola]BEI91124.1 hypothetical protein CcaverHIS019_0311940 [Cutaneotrichosporon cavernicola]